mgnify:CR=1 FL=1
MAVYLDRARVQFKEKLRCHLMADTLEELHIFAQNMNIDARLFHRNASYPHYDITLEMREMALLYGAFSGTLDPNSILGTIVGWMGEIDKAIFIDIN